MIAERPDERSYLWMTLLLSLALHLVFVAWIQPQAARSHPQAMKLPDLAFWAQSPGESRALYSPVLFALPTPMGFSASMLNQALHSDPPIREQADVLSMLEVEDRLAGSSDRDLFTELHDQVNSSFDRLPPIRSAETPWNAVPGVSARLDGDQVFRDRAPSDWLTIPGAGDTVWMAEFSVDLDKDSRVRRVLLLQRPAFGPSADALVRWMYRQIFKPGPTASGRVAVRWIPPETQVGS